ncbi:hypothetical protein NDU88_002597 [Pleurodeles waltl]|uniref:Uncharacterized protein n=1 Tax=Pleurodeles waltl TaxID=8319 RepID=A0AAV7RDV1_PLEWA|nr:hypothetical protein NDU88_002597 [Pleurodeles waltl]
MTYRRKPEQGSQSTSGRNLEKSSSGPEPRTSKGREMQLLQETSLGWHPADGACVAEKSKEKRLVKTKQKLGTLEPPEVDDRREVFSPVEREPSHNCGQCSIKRPRPS